MEVFRSHCGECEFMRSLVVKRSIAIGGRETSISLEDAFWTRLKEIARYRQMTVSDLPLSILIASTAIFLPPFAYSYSTFIVRTETKLNIILMLR